MKIIVKNTLFYCLFLCLTFTITNCKEESLSPEEQTKTQLLKDEDFIAYSKASKDFREKSSIDYYGYTHLKQEILEKELPKVKTEDDVIKAYELAGMDSFKAKEFISTTQILSKNINLLLQRYSYLKTISNDEAIKFIVELTEKPKFDYNKIKQNKS